LTKALASARHTLAFGAINEGAQLADFVVKHAPVEFDLLFTGPPAKADPALLALQVGPPPNETGGLMLHLGQLNFYLEALDRDHKKLHENPAIGLLLCASKDDEVVEYALSRSLSPAVVAQYQNQLPDKKLLQAKLHEFYLANVGEGDAE
jgi:hypothetical protein